MSKFAETVNGWGSVFRLVTPALIGVLIWIVTNGQAQVHASLGEIRGELKTLSNDYFHQLAEIKERLGHIEGRNVVIDKVKTLRP